MTATGMTGRGYPISAVHSAQRLRAAGETLDEIADYIGETYGVRPCTKTVSVWTSQRVAAGVRKRRLHASQEHSRKGGFTGGRLGRSRHSDAFRLARMVALRDAGLPPAAIATVMTFDYGEPITGSEVAERLRRTWKDRARTMLMAAPDLSTQEMVRRLDVSRSSVHKFRKQAGL